MLIYEITDFVTNFQDALTIKERIKIYKKFGIISQDYIQLQNWINTRGVVVEADVYKMIELNGTSVEDFNLGLKELSQDEKSHIKGDLENIDWLKDYNQIIRSYLDKDEIPLEKVPNLDLSLSIIPFIAWAGDKLNEVVKCKKNILISDETIVKLLEKFTSVLVSMSIKTLVWELHNSGFGSMDIKKENNDEMFKKFIEHTFLIRENLVGFYDRHPVTARRLTVKSNQLIDYFTEMFSHLDENYKEICNALDIHCIKNIVGNVDCDQGDTHQKGRFVIKLYIDNQIIVYKPRDLRIQQKFYEFSDYVSRMAGMLDLYVNKAFYSKKYTFEKFVEYKPCVNQQEVVNFYKRFGQLCALIYTLSGNDIHYENIIAYSEYPVIIDVETLFQHQSDIINLTPNAFYKAYRECIESVGGTALIPIIAFGKENKSKGINFSALNGGEQTLPFKVLSIKDANTDSMRFEYSEVTMSSAHNIPMLNNEKVLFSDYTEHILSGFESILSFICDNKQKIIGDTGVLNMFKGTLIRHLFKATLNYVKLMEFSSHPNYSANMIKLERMLSNAWSYNYKDKRIISFEVSDMLEGDIPIFFGIVDSKDVITSNEDTIHNYFLKSSFDNVVERIANLSAFEIQKQLSQIKICFGMYESLCQKNFAKRVRKDINFAILEIFSRDRELLLLEAQRIADIILSEAILEEDTQTITWNNVMFDDINECWKVRPLDEGLSSGLSWLLLFFYQLNKYLNKREYEEVIQILLLSINTLPIKNVKIGVYDGSSSVLYPLLVMYKDTNNPDIYTSIYIISKSILDNFDKIESNSLIDGHAGIALMMLNIYQLTNEEMYLSIAERCVDRILQNTVLDYGADISMANGLSGIYYVLKQFNNKNQNIELFCQRITKLVNKSIHNLNDASWEYGLNGLLMTQSNKNDGPVVYEQIKDVILSDKCDDSLAKGVMGTINLLLKYFYMTADTVAKKAIETTISQVIAQKELNEVYSYYTIDGYNSVGLFNGLSGIGYTFLRLYNFEETPDVLA